MENVNESIDSHLQILNNLFKKYATYKELNKQERNFQQKLWITKGLQVSIKKKKLNICFLYLQIKQY